MRQPVNPYEILHEQLEAFAAVEERVFILAWRRLGGWSREGWRKRAAVSVLLCSVCISAGTSKVLAGWKREKAQRKACICMHVLDRVYGQTVFGGTAGFHPRQDLACDFHLVFFPLPPTFVLCLFYNHHLFPNLFLSLTTPSPCWPEPRGL